jgi:hypothetical protein
MTSDRAAESDGGGPWPYLGVGCLTTVIGLAGGGMIGVLVARVAGAIRKCPVAAETRAPCEWDVFWRWGAVLGLVLVPTISIWRMRRGRLRARANEETN